MINLYQPLISLQKGHWFKLICGASLQYLPAVRNLTLAYALAGADCIDVAADPAVIRTAQAALAVAKTIAFRAGKMDFSSPWLMVSLNDGEDPHFRKAQLQPEDCPVDCSQPCVAICPAQAITFDRLEDTFAGVIDPLCYGCGRCLPVCPIQQISTRSYRSTPGTVGFLIEAGEVDAVEIHTQIGRLAEFQTLWQAIAPYAHQLKILAVSCSDGEGLIDYLWSLYDILSPLSYPLIWQTDGRPMSGDIGDGTTRSTLKLGEKVLSAGLPGYVQLAGGTNRWTVPKLRAMGLLATNDNQHPNSDMLRHQAYIAGVAYGSFARTLLWPVLHQFDQAVSDNPSYHLEENPLLLEQAVALAELLVIQLKGPSRQRSHADRSRSISLGSSPLSPD